MASDKLEEFLHELIALNEQKRKATDLEQLLSAYQVCPIPADRDSQPEG